MGEADKELIGHCGLYCGDCFGHTGTIADLARDLRKELRRAKFPKFAEAVSSHSFFEVLKYYPQCYQVLGTMVKFRCKKGCRAGGGPPYCKVRRCCQKKNIAGCWECVEFETCEKLDFLKAVHGDGHLRNLRNLNRKGVAEFLRGKTYWYSLIKEEKSKAGSV